MDAPISPPFFLAASRQPLIEHEVTTLTAGMAYLFSLACCSRSTSAWPVTTPGSTDVGSGVAVLACAPQHLLALVLDAVLLVLVLVLDAVLVVVLPSPRASVGDAVQSGAVWWLVRTHPSAVATRLSCLEQSGLVSRVSCLLSLSVFGDVRLPAANRR